MISRKVVFILAGAVLITAARNASAQGVFTPGNLLVSASTYAGNSGTIVIGSTILPASSPQTTAIANGSYPTFTNNDNADSNFGITSPLSLIEVNPTTGTEVQNYSITSNTGMVTSFTSKSEGSLNLSADGKSVSVMGYNSTINQLDISNSNTPGDLNGATTTAPNTNRAVSQIFYNGTGTLTLVNDYSGDNPRAASLASNGFFYTVGNTGDKSSGAQAFTGAQIVTPGSSPSPSTSFSNTTSLGSYNITQNGYSADKIPKDNNFRGLTIYNNTEYVAKGSGSNGIDTVYQVGTAGTLPTGTGNTIAVLPGFNTLAATNDLTNSANSNFGHPFGLWFANATTLYVGDEGSGQYSDITTLASNPSSTLVNGEQFGGIDKYVYNGSTWVLQYVLKTGLNIGTGGQNGSGQYTVSGTTPGGDSGSYVVESTGGIRDITGKVNSDGTVTIYGITSTASTNTDEGADPNKLVKVTDTLAYTSANASQAAAENFTTLQTAAYGQVFRGVAFAPSITQGELSPSDTPTMPVWALILMGGLLFLLAMKFLPKQDKANTLAN